MTVDLVNHVLVCCVNVVIRT